MLGCDLDRQVRAYLSALRSNGAVVNTAIAIGCAEGIIKHFDSNLLECNGGHIRLTKSWAQCLMLRLGFGIVADFDWFKTQFIFDIRAVIEMEEIPGELVINWDQTGIYYVPVSSWIMAREGSKRVEIAGIDDKKQITTVFARTMKGDFLPSQLMYRRKISKSLPHVKFSPDWHNTFSENHWSNETSMIGYLENILFLYIKKEGRVKIR